MPAALAGANTVSRLSIGIASIRLYSTAIVSPAGLQVHIASVEDYQVAMATYRLRSTVGRGQSRYAKAPE